MEGEQMKQDEITIDECKANWREEARKRANREAKENGLRGDEALEFVHERQLEIYHELQEIGEDNIN